MKQAVKKPDRQAFFNELLHYAAAYYKLTEQCEKMALAGEDRQAENMIILRGETIRKIDELEELCRDYIADTDGADAEEVKKRAELNRIFGECAEIENRLLPLMQEKMKSLQKQAHKLKNGRKAIQGYGASVKPQQRPAVYIEEKK